MNCVRIKITGIVQGVFFRKFTQLKANGMGIKGWVRNADDGTVEIEACAPAEHLDEFIRWCHHGPEHAVVNKVEVTESPIKIFTSFDIRR